MPAHERSPRKAKDAQPYKDDEDDGHIYVCITKDGAKHEIEALTARHANMIAERRYGYANIAVPPQESLRSPTKDAAPFTENRQLTDLAEKVQRMWLAAPNTREGIDDVKVKMREAIKAAGTTPEQLAVYVTKMATASGRRVNVNHIKNLARDAKDALPVDCGGDAYTLSV